MTADDENKNPFADKTLIRRKTLRETAVLSDTGLLLRRNLQNAAQGGTATIGEQREVIMVIRGMIERVMISENTEFKLGRYEPMNRKPNEIDLTPYGALDRGVSREHAKIHFENEHLYITDLNSTNGTYLAGTKLEPMKPMLVRKGDELMVGRLAIQVMFR